MEQDEWREPKNQAERDLLVRLKSFGWKFANHMRLHYPNDPRAINLLSKWSGDIKISTRDTGASFKPSGCMIMNPYNFTKSDTVMDPEYRMITRLLHELAHSTSSLHSKEFYDTHRFFVKIATEELGQRIDVNCKICCESQVPCTQVCPKCTWLDNDGTTVIDPQTCHYGEKQCRTEDPPIKYPMPFVPNVSPGPAPVPKPAPVPAPVPKPAPAPAPVPSKMTTTPAPVPKPVPVSKPGGTPVLPTDHANNGVSKQTIDDIQAWYMTQIRKKTKTQYKYNPKQDGFVQVSTKLNNVNRRGAANDEERMILGYFQYQCKALLDAVKKTMPGGEATRLAQNFANSYVAIDATDNHQGMMATRPNGNSIMTVNIGYNIAKTHNIIAHEMAHCALHGTQTTAHNQRHTDLWKKFVKIGIEKLGWKFVQFSYPNCCEKYNICDLREFDQAVVFNDTIRKCQTSAATTCTSGKSYGSTFVSWAPNN